MKLFAGLPLLFAAVASATPSIQDILQNYASENDALPALKSGLHKRQTPPGDMPVIDLGYVKQRATEYGVAGNVGYYLFRNIRFAAPPVGELRFKKPQAPSKETTIQDGSFNSSTACVQPGSNGSEGTEDCLFLDVWMPVSASTKRPLPVLANWYGGGYAFGSKETAGSPVGLWESGAPPFVYVTPNYRLGVYGWMSVPDVDITPNAGLHDVIHSMEWIRKHIGKFGGDLSRSTAMGLSAGGGVVMHSMVSTHRPYIPFQQVILQSPGWQPETTPAGRLPIYKTLLKNTNCNTTSCLRSLSSEALGTGNLFTMLLWNTDALGPTSGFYPVPDGDLLLDHPANLFAAGKVHPTVKRAIASSARWEAGTGFFSVPENTTDALFAKDIAVSLTSNQTLIDILADAYPPDGTSKSGYNRSRDLTGDLGFNCNSLWVLRYFSQLSSKSSGEKQNKCKPGTAKAKGAWRFEFNIGEAGHGTDSTYTWFETLGPVEREDLVKYQQEWLVDFVIKRKVDWPMWKIGDEQAWWLNDTGPGLAEDYFKWDHNVKRCDVIRTQVIGKGGAVN